MMVNALDKPKNMNALAHRIAELGYHPVPIQPGRKGPTFANWQRYDATPSNIDRDFPAAGVVIGCLHDNLGCIDVDVYDAELSQKIAAEFRTRFPTALERVGQAPKTAFVFRLPETPYTVTNTAKYSHEGKEGQVEIRTKTGQMVVYGKHPETKQPYTWPAGDLWETPIEALPMPGEWEIQDFRDWAEKALMDWAGVQEVQEPQQALIIDFGSYANGNDGPPSEAAIADALSYITPHCAHDEWVEVLMALHDYYKGSAAGLTVAQTWSSPHSSYDPREVAAKWKSFKGDGVSYTTLFHHAKQGGADLSEMARKHRPDPVAERMQAQNHAMSIALEPEQPDQPQQEEAKAQGEWPTPYDMFDASILPRREWIYGYDYIKKYISVTASAGGIGKTSAIIVEALAIASGKPLLGTAVKSQENTWVINLEDPMSEMQMRTIAAMKHHDLKPSEVKGKLFMDGEDTMSITLAAEGRDGLITNDALIEHMTKKIKANNIGVVIIDPFVSTHLVNENNNGSVQAVVSMLRKLARDTNTSIMLVHHIRKTNGEDATVDSVRGAVSLIGAARAARVINRITPEDAMALGVNENESRGIFRIDDGKANLAPPSDKAVYRQMVSVEIANGEHIGVATEFKLPDLFDGVTAKDLYKVQRTVGEAEQNDDAYRSDVRAKNWIGVAVAEQLGLDLDKPGDKARAKAIAKKWISTNALKVENIASKRHGREVPCVIVGEWVDWAEVQ